MLCKKIFIITYIHYYTSVVHYTDVSLSVNELKDKIEHLVNGINERIHQRCKIEQIKEYVEGKPYEIHTNDYFNGGDYIISVKEVLINC